MLLTGSEKPGCAASFSTSSRCWTEKVAIDRETEKLADGVETETVVCWQVLLPSKTPVLGTIAAYILQDGEDVEDFLTRCAPSKLLGRSRIAIKNPWDIERSEGNVEAALATLEAPLQEALSDWNAIIADDTLNKVIYLLSLFRLLTD